jgi:antitoxin (DNA-binding transcriptional repressor) of toxin-antitoxin stability system
MIQVTINEAQQRLPELLVAVESGENVKIEGENGRNFRLITDRPRPAITGIPKVGRLKGQLVVPGDINDTLEELQEYME